MALRQHPFLLLVLLFSLPETTIDRIPSSLIPAIYTGLIYLIANKFQGQTLQEHKDNRGEFHSAWRAAGIGLVFSLLIVAGVVGYIYASEPDHNFDTVTYQHNINLFIDNEAQTLVVFDKMGYLEDDKLINEFNHGKNLWKQNVVLTNEILAIDDLPEELENLVSKLRIYSELRITFYNLFNKAFTEETDEYGPQIESVALQIEKVLSELD